MKLIEGLIIAGVVVLGAALIKKKDELVDVVAGVPATVLDSVIDRLAVAIATAEGFYVRNSRAARNNNPGNLTLDLSGGGAAVGRDGLFVVYANVDDGWTDLKKQIRLMFGGSRIYNREMSISEVANKYTTTARVEWASIVARVMGVTRATRLSELA